jgi:hypothetical protein
MVPVVYDHCHQVLTMLFILQNMNMNAVYEKGVVRANCGACGALSTFTNQLNGRYLDSFTKTVVVMHNGNRYNQAAYQLLACSGCEGGAIAKILHLGTVEQGALIWFYPSSASRLPLPALVPVEIETEFREAERCISAQCFRAASALARSTLEKTLKVNGYTKGDLKAKIDQAAADGIVTASRQQRMHDDIRVVGNDILHDDWSAVSEAEVMSTMHYTQRVLEDFYDDRTTVAAIITQKQRKHID